MDVQVRFDEKDATVRYLPAKVTLEQILRRYDDTPFGVIPSGPVVTIARTTHGKVRVWTERTPAVPGGAKSDSDRDAPTPIRMFLEYSAKGTGSSASVPELSLADPPAAGLAQLEAFKQVADVASVSDGSASTRYLAKLYETVALPPGEVIVPVTLVIKTKEQGDNEASLTTRLEVVLRTTREAASNSTPATTGVTLIDGTLDLKLGHLCDQRGCVQHFHQSLKEISGLAAINPHPSLENPGATAYLRAGQPIDLWSLREDLRDQSIEVAGIEPAVLPAIKQACELARRPALLVEIVFADQLFEEAQLIVGVDDGVIAAQSDQLGMAAQHLRADRVKGAEPWHPLDRVADVPSDPLAHLACGLIGEGDAENLARPGAARSDEVRKPCSERGGFAGSRACQHQHRSLGGQHGDGAFAMNPGCLIVERYMNLPNLTHILVSNRVYGSTFEVPLPYRDHADYILIAKGFGIHRVFGINSVDELKANFDEAFLAPGHSVVVLEHLVMPDEKLTPKSQDGPEMKFNFGRHIERLTGKEIFARPTGGH